MGTTWDSKQFLIMTVVVVGLTGAFHVLAVSFVSLLFKGYTMHSPACTLNCVVVIVLLGLRQNFHEQKLVTPIPIYENTLKIPFKVRPCDETE
jgi:hypothetical protein